MMVKEKKIYKWWEWQKMKIEISSKRIYTAIRKKECIQIQDGERGEN